MGQNHVDVFRDLHVVDLRVEATIDHRFEFPAVVSADADGGASQLSAVFDAAQHVRRVAAARDPHDDVARHGEVLQLLDEDRFIIHIVGDREDPGKAVSKCHDFEFLLDTEAGALVQITGQMRGGGRAAAVAQQEDGLLPLIGVFQDVGNRVDLAIIQRGENSSQPRYVLTDRARVVLH